MNLIKKHHEEKKECDSCCPKLCLDAELQNKKDLVDSILIKFDLKPGCRAPISIYNDLLECINHTYINNTLYTYAFDACGWYAASALVYNTESKEQCSDLSSILGPNRSIYDYDNGTTNADYIAATLNCNFNVNLTGKQVYNAFSKIICTANSCPSVVTYDWIAGPKNAYVVQVLIGNRVIIIGA